MDTRDFSKFSFVSMTGPGIGRLVLLIALLGVAAGLGAGALLQGRLAIEPWAFTAGFVACNLVSGFLVHKIVRGFKAKWAYFTVLVNETSLIVIASLFIFSSKITFFDSLVLWTSVSYTVWMLVLSGIGSVRIGPKAVLISFVQPAALWSLFIASLRITPQDLAAPLAIMGVGVVVSTLVILLTEHVFSLVFVGISGLSELSKFLKGLRGEHASLDIGRNIDALVQYLMFRTDKEHVLLAPWLHSGPLRSVGGGDLSTQCIEKLNKAHGESYVFHVPSNHEYNPSGDVSGRIVGAVAKPSYQPLRASRVVAVGNADLGVTGQRLNDAYLLSLSGKRIDDYDISIFSSLRDLHKKEKIIFVDSHQNPPMKECVNVEAFSAEAKALEALVDEMLQKLSKEPLAPAKVGTAISSFGQSSVFAMAVKSKETALYFIADINGFSPKEIQAVRDAAGKCGADKTLLFTTDTHSLSVKALVEKPDMPRDVIDSVISKAFGGLRDAEFAYGEGLVKNVRILGKTYYELVTIVRIMTRVIPVLFVLFFLFLGILLWIF